MTKTKKCEQRPKGAASARQVALEALLGMLYKHQAEGNDAAVAEIAAAILEGTE